MKVCPIAYKLCQSELKTLPITKETLNILPKIFNYLPKWCNFAKSGHTARLEASIFHFRDSKKFLENIFFVFVGGGANLYQAKRVNNDHLDFQTPAVYFIRKFKSNHFLSKKGILRSRKDTT